MVRTVRRSQTVLVALAVFLGLAASAQADVFNGDFELGDLGWGREGITSFPSLGSNRIAVLNENDAYSQSDAEGNFDYSSITQGFQRQATETHLHFDFTLSGPYSETDYFQVLLNGTVVDIAATDDSALADGEWHHVTHDISALPVDPTWNTLTFRLKGYSDHPSLSWVELDNVRLVAVPVPAAALLASIGLACAARRLRRS